MDPKPGYKTTEFQMTTAGMFIVTLSALLAAFHIVTITEDQRHAVLEFAPVAWIALPSVYAVARSWVKAKAVSPPQTAISATSVASDAK